MTGTPQKSLNNQESRYIVTNDGIGVTELRNNSAGPMVPSAQNPMNNGPALTTPTFIPPLKYIVYNNPQQVYNLLSNLGYRVKNTIPSTYEFAKFYVRDRREDAVNSLMRLHPDKDLIFKAWGVQPKESSFTETPAASTNPVTPTPTETKTPEAPAQQGGWKISSNTIIILLIIAIFFILITRKN